ncbi:MAG: glycine cleavage system protein H [Thermoguttaceae bacterium]
MERFYTTTHEWVTLSGTTATVGITDVAVELLTDLIYLQLPEVGRSVEAGSGMGEVESVKAVSDINAPVSGKVIEVNTAVADALEKLTADPFGAGWLVKIETTPPLPTTLLSETAYRAIEREH